MKFLSLTACALIATLISAQAQTPRLRDAITVRGATISLSDLLEGVNEGAPLFMAPAPGSTGTIRAQRVKEAALQAGITDVDWRALPHVAVTRAARRLDLKAVQEDVQAALAEKLNLPPSMIELQWDGSPDPQSWLLPEDGPLLADLKLDGSIRRFSASLDPQRPERERPILTGRYRELIETAVLKKPLARGEALTADHLTTEKRAKHEMADAINPAQAVGLVAKNGLAVGQVLRQADLTKPILVERNSLVTVSFQTPGMALQLRGRSQDQGALGDAITILNPVSKKIVIGIVTGPGRALVNPEQQDRKQ